ncbi:MAG: aldo/keto reductase [Armatimonadetes bacterium]|nr:aldo/keto reductase [Armatimonadota bacterium]
MHYRPLARTGVQVSMLCLGCARLGSTSDEAESIELIDRALDLGINFIDTANVYGPSEDIVGRALARDGKRANVVLATKFGSPLQGVPLNGRGGSRRHIVEQCERSLRRLQTDWIDLYYFHLPSPDIPIDEALRALDDLVRAGKVRYLGTSNFAAWQLTEALWCAKELGLNRFVAEQPAYNLLDRTTEIELMPFAQTYGVALNPYSPLAEGVLAGRYRGAAAGAVRFAADSQRLAQHTTPAANAVVETVAELAVEKGCSLSQLALAWTAAQPAVCSPIIGPRRREQLEDNVGAAGVAITEEDCRRLDAVAPRGGELVRYRYNYMSYFGPHPHRW